MYQALSQGILGKNSQGGGLPRSYVNNLKILCVILAVGSIFWLGKNWDQDSVNNYLHRPGGSAPAPAKKPEGPVVIPPGDHSNTYGNRVAILTYTTSDKSYTYTALKNKYEYAERHGYQLYVDWEAPEKRGVMWHKFTMAERVIAAGQHDWMWWVDFDTLFTNMSFPAHEQIHRLLRQLPPERAEEIDALLSPDCFELNAGSMIYRARPSTVEFFNQVRAWHDGHWDNNEQDCVREATKLASNKTWERYAELHRDPPPFARDAPFKVTDYGSMHEHKQVLMTHQSDINPFPDEIKCHERDEETWKAGMIIVHFAGAWAHMKDDKDATGTLMKKYSQLVVGR